MAPCHKLWMNDPCLPPTHAHPASQGHHITVSFTVADSLQPSVCTLRGHVQACAPVAHLL